ncbi:MAG: long-chain fatty acid--CoA ligase, partial [Candidatus Eisenbacteria bacterium]|nr:long-chain fatty acid--CoA ligase [Candidatus Eisenbacteria bacterium]
RIPAERFSGDDPRGRTAPLMERPWLRHYPAGVPADVALREVTLADLFVETARAHAERDALYFLNRSTSFGDLARDVDALAASLSQLGVAPRSRVAIQMPNLPQTVIAFLAVLRLGAVPVMTNPLYTPREIEHQWNDAGCCAAVVMDYLFEQKLASLRDRLPIEHFVIAQIPDYLRFPLRQLARLKLRRADPPLIAGLPPGSGIHVFTDLVARGGSPPPVALDLDAPALIQYTGGTTGVAKGAVLTQRNLTANVQQLAAWFPALRAGEDVFLAALPFFHIFGITAVLGLACHTGCAMALVPDPRDTASVVEALEKRRVTLMLAVPAMYGAILRRAKDRARNLRSIKYAVSGSAPLPATVQAEFHELTGATVVEGYGLTETSPVTHCNPIGGVVKNGTIGVPIPNTEVRLVDPEDVTRDADPGQPGEIVVRGPQVMQGYWNRPEESAASLIGDGWLRTGDLGSMDADGYFRIVGRQKDMIKASGFNVYPDEVDHVLSDHPAVAESCTIGIPDEHRGETVKSFVVRAPGSPVTAEELLAHCREHLAAYKVPREIEFREDLPRSAALKLLRRQLRAEELARRGAGASDGSQPGGDS